jgi:hypothetical protein
MKRFDTYVYIENDATIKSYLLFQSYTLALFDCDIGLVMKY